jgi:selenocysteine lyase/cysteine desulfurase
MADPGFYELSSKVYTGMDWKSLRSEFPVTQRWAYFDHAAVAPLSGRARKALGEWAADLAANGDAFWGQWMKRCEDVRRQFGLLINADPFDIAFIKNTSEGIGFVAEGFPWQAGDNMVTTADEYPSNVYPWLNVASRGVEARRVASHAGRILVDDIIGAIDDRTRLVSLSSVEFASGFRNDLSAVGEYCHRRGIFFFVDAIQSLGVLPLDVSQLPIDGLAADGHKWLLGPEGAGIFYLRSDWVDRLHTIEVGWNSVIRQSGSDAIDFRLKPHAGRWESGSLNMAGIHALGASLELLRSLGIPALANRVLEITDYLCERAQRFGLIVYSSRESGEKSGIVSLLKPNEEPSSLVRRCKNEGIIVAQRAGRIRVSPHCYNTLEEIDRLIDCLARQERSEG